MTDRTITYGFLADVLPSLLHQDPRYFYQGTGSGKSRAIHAMSYAIICKGDNGRSQFNYSGIGGNLIAGALIKPLLSAKQSRAKIGFLQHGHQRRGPARQCLVQEFILRKYTTNANQ